MTSLPSLRRQCALLDVRDSTWEEVEIEKIPDAPPEINGAGKTPDVVNVPEQDDPNVAQRFFAQPDN